MEEHNRSLVMPSAALLICSESPKEHSVGVLPPAHTKNSYVAIEAAIMSTRGDSCEGTSDKDYMKNIF